MKKKSKLFFIITVITLLVSFSWQCAVAEKVEFVLGGDNNRLTGVLNAAELEKFSVKPEVAIERATEKIGGVGNYGRVIRHKGVIQNDTSATTIIEAEVIWRNPLFDSVKNLSAQEIVEKTIIYNETYVCHRFSTGGKIVAILQVNGNKELRIEVTDWNQDGEMDEWAFVPTTSDKLDERIQ